MGRWEKRETWSATMDPRYRRSDVQDIFNHLVQERFWCVVRISELCREENIFSWQHCRNGQLRLHGESCLPKARDKKWLFFRSFGRWAKNLICQGCSNVTSGSQRNSIRTSQQTPKTYMKQNKLSRLVVKDRQKTLWSIFANAVRTNISFLWKSTTLTKSSQIGPTVLGCSNVTSVVSAETRTVSCSCTMSSWILMTASWLAGNPPMVRRNSPSLLMKPCIWHPELKKSRTHTL